MESAKKVITYDSAGVENGYLIELKKNGRRTEAYLTVARAQCFKGFHLHRVRESNYVCIKGKVNILLAEKDGVRCEAMNVGDKLHIPINVPVAIDNAYEEEAWLINFPEPAYDPLLTFEQVDIAREDIEKWIGENYE